jgi:hypothetical protein
MTELRRGLWGVGLVAPLGVGLEIVVGVGGGVLLLLGVLEVFEEVGVEDGGGDLVVSGGPLAEVDGATALGAEGDFGGVEGDEFFADGAVEGFGHGEVRLIDFTRLEGVVAAFRFEVSQGWSRDAKLP